MSYMMCAKIVFPDTKVRKEVSISLVSSVSIESSWKMLTDTANIILPRRIRKFQGEELKDILRAGDPVRIELGYDGNMYTE